MTASHHRYDTIVVGLGAMGSATLFHLASRGQRVLGIEQFAPGHTLGSSHGDSRIIREQYFEHPLYVPLVQRAYSLWRELEGLTYRSLLTQTGGLMIGPRDGEVVTGSLRSAKEHGLRSELLDAREVHRRFPAFELRADLVAVFDPRAGVLDADACNQAHLDMARARGAKAHFDEPVLEWNATGTGVIVSTPKGTYEASRLLIAAGGWTPKLVPLLASALEVERQVLVWFRPDHESNYELRVFPVYCYEFSPGRINFGVGRTRQGVKAGIHHIGELSASGPESVRRVVSAEDIVALRESLRPVLPVLADATQVAASTCLYTNTSDQHFLVDWHPDHPNVLLSSACSGHGFKFSSVIGEIQADLLTNGRSTFDLTPFKLARLRPS